MAQHYVRTGSFPNGKSLDEQDALLFQDMQDVLTIIAREEWLISKKRDDSKESDDWEWRDDENREADDQQSPQVMSAQPDITPTSRFNVN